MIKNNTYNTTKSTSGNRLFPVSNLKKIDDEILKDILQKDFPLLFKEDSVTDSLTCRIYCRSGWNILIYELSEALNDIAVDFQKIYPDSKIKVNHIKEKFGRLSYSANVNGLPKNLKEMIILFIKNKAEASKSLCEICGESGFVREDLRWVKSLCGSHYREFLLNNRE